MKLYAIITSFNYEGSSVLYLFSDKEKANNKFDDFINGKEDAFCDELSLLEFEEGEKIKDMYNNFIRRASCRKVFEFGKFNIFTEFKTK